MSKKNFIWRHKKYGKRNYESQYAIEQNTGERCFILRGKMKNGKTHNLAFESHQAAKELGWKSLSK